MQWAGSSTEPKSWVHVCIFLDGSADMLTGLPLPANIKLYDAQGLSRLIDDLDDLAAHMTRLLSNYRGVSPDSALREAVKSTAAAIADWPRDKRNTRLSIETSAQLEEGLYLFAVEDEADEATEESMLKPSRNVVPLDVSSGVASFEGALMRLIEAGDGRLLFSTEHRNYPFIFRLSTVDGGGTSTLDLWFDVDKSNVPQALGFWALVEAIKSSGSVSLTGPSGDVAVLSLVG